MGSRYTTSGAVSSPRPISSAAWQRPAMLSSPACKRMRDTAAASAGSSAARSKASLRSAAITQSCSYRSTVKPAAASSSESSPKPAVASIAHGLSMPFARAAFTSSSCCKRPCLSRGSMRPKSARSSIVPSVSVRPSGFPVSSSPAARATEKGSTTPMDTP